MRIIIAILTIGVLVGCNQSRQAAHESASAPDDKAQPVSASADTLNSPQTAGHPSAEQLAELARRVVTTSIRIHPGDVVVIDGGKHTTGLMEAVAIEAQKAGGMPTMWLESDRVVRSMLTDVPDLYIDQKPTYIADWYRHTTVWIGLGWLENPKAVFADVPEAKLARWAATGQVINDMLDASPIRGAFIDYPTPARAADVGLSFDQYSTMQWAAIGTDYGQIAAAGKALKDNLASAKQVHITSPSGTDLRFDLAQRPIILNAGILSANASKEKMIMNRFASLPGGSVALAPQETSIAGVIAVPRDRCKFNPLTDARYEFEKGTMVKAGAKEGDACLQENLKTYGPGIHRVGAFTIGLNPELKVVEDNANYRPAAAAGMVTLSLGDNQLLGGANRVPGGVTTDVPVSHATVEIDGKKVVEDGKLVGETVAQATQ